MDKELQSRNLGSATVRKHRMQERQKQKDLLYEQRQDRKRRMTRYSEIYSTDGSDQSRANSPETDSAAGTPSEHSVTSPATTASPEIMVNSQAITWNSKALSAHAEEQITILPHVLTDLNCEPTTTTSKPVMFTASLNRPCDFRYDRFSTFMEPIDQLKDQDEAQAETDDDDDADDSSSDIEHGDDDYSPIEVATPVAIRMPVTRPSVISVVTATGSTQSPQKFSVKNINAIMINPPQHRLQELKPTLQIRSSNNSGYSAAEAQPLDINLSTSSTASLVDGDARASQQDTPKLQSCEGEESVANNSLKKKASMPMLTRAHARMHSIKNFIKPQSISEPPPAVPIIPSNHQTRPSENLNNILLANQSLHTSKPSVTDKQLPTSPRRSLTEPNLLRVTPQQPRPQTARMASYTSATAGHDPPPLPPQSARSPSTTPSPRPLTPPEEIESQALSRKKSFANLRRRSGSIGQALKFSTGKSRSPVPDAPPPPLPIIRVPTNGSVQSLSFPTPPPKSPRSFRKSGMNLYSPFPPAAQKEVPIGLGLRI